MGDYPICRGGLLRYRTELYMRRELHRPGPVSSALAHSIKELQGIQNSKVRPGLHCHYEHLFKQGQKMTYFFDTILV